MCEKLHHSLSQVNNNSLSDGLAAESGLDLIYGHLITDGKYRPVHRHTEKQPEGWRCSSSEHSLIDGGNLVAKIQRFHAGGYEVLCRRVDLPGLARMIDAPRRTGQREKPEMVDPEVIARSIKRSKTHVRYKIKSMGADRLFTLTRRESEPDEFWTLQQWADAWRVFCRHAKRAGIELDYVAVPEHHKKGNYHLHVALKGHINIKIARGIWWAVCGGRGMGNVDVKFRGDLPSVQRLAGLAKYLSKYLTKQFDDSAFNKKRYWSSKHKLPPVERLILSASDVLSALNELGDYLALDIRQLINSKLGAFIFPDRFNPSGFWFNYSESLCSEPPF